MKSQVKFTVEFVAIIDEALGDSITVIDEVERAVKDSVEELRQNGDLSKVSGMRANFRYVKGGAR